MKDTVTEFKVNDKNYKLVFNLNVMQSIQKKYESLKKWGELTSSSDEHEPSIDAVLFGFTEMLNEAIDIDNEENSTQIPFYTEKQVGRLITALGIEKSTEQLQNTVIKSTEVESSKNV